MSNKNNATFFCALILKCKTPSRLAAWYRDVLGIPMKARGDDFSGMVGRVHFAIHGLSDGQSPTTGAELGFHIAGLDAFVAGLAAKGVALADPIREYPWARSAQIRDPLGNTVYLMELPEASLRALDNQ